MPLRRFGGRRCGMAPAVSEFKAVIVDRTDTLDVAFQKAFIRFPVLLARWYVTVFDENGEFTQSFKDKLCAACPQLQTP